MAATVTASKSYDLSGGALREDLESIIWDISPQDTWMINGIDKIAVKSTIHEWLTDTLTAPSSTNAAIEGDAFAGTARTLPARLKNQTQISRKEFAVTGTAQKVDPANPARTIPDNRLSVIDLRATPPAVVQTLEAGAGASGVSVNRAGTLALVANRNAGTVSVFRIADANIPTCHL